MAAMQLTRTHRILIGVVIAGAVVIAAIGFAGSYAAVRELAENKGFGSFSLVFPIGIDAGICVLLALDLLLTWMRIPFPLLRQTAWLLTAATIAFNGAASWPDPLGTAMHAVIPVLFVVAVEAARHAVGRIADITADKHMEGVRLTRWLLSPVPTFKLWRRMKLWELRSYEQVIKLEQDRLIYQARLQARFGRNWRRKAPVESMMPLRLAKYGVPLAETAPAGLAAAGIEPALLPPVEGPRPKAELPYEPGQGRPGDHEHGREQGDHGHEQAYGDGPGRDDQHPQQRPHPHPHPQDQQHPQEQGRQPHPQDQQPHQNQPQQPQQTQQTQQPHQPHPQGPLPQQQAPAVPPTHDSPWFATQKLPDGTPHQSAYDPHQDGGLEHAPVRARDEAGVEAPGEAPGGPGEAAPGKAPADAPVPAEHADDSPAYAPEDAPQLEQWPQEDNEYANMAFESFSAYKDEHGSAPGLDDLVNHLAEDRDVRHPHAHQLLQRLWPEFEQVYASERTTADQTA
ncbi:DUF2637 domain-containing protein [Streptomyces violaceoruber]|uniref:DUF2637 domain-containing protein n=1 Tax=Streptomyces violaceoruber TaxID=1935 RepID=UPI001F358BD6|nr:DUF2637 domain-containing protein [Streptomyces violaceoruber]MCF3170086.1 DUF2637 domain-containing protein [Streptomyces violaceoruber]